MDPYNLGFRDVTIFKSTTVYGKTLSPPDFRDISIPTVKVAAIPD